MKSHGFPALVAVILISGCGGDDSGRAASEGQDPAFEEACARVPGCTEPPRFEAPGPRETIWRVLVVREPGGEIRIDQVDSIDVPEGDGVPVGPLAGTHMLVGLDGADEPVDAQLLSFPAVLSVEYAAGGATPRDIDLSGRLVDTVGYVRALPTVERLVVRDRSGATVAETRARPTLAFALEASRLLTAGPALALTDNSGTWPYLHNLPPYCAHVRILEGERDRGLASGLTWALREQGTDIDSGMVVPEPTQRALVYAALRRMTPLLCQSISRIVWVSLPPEADFVGAVASAMGDLILLNEPYFSESRLTDTESDWLPQDLVRTVSHEAGHSALILLDAQGMAPGFFPGDWTLEPRMLASQTLDQVRLHKSLADEWNRVHESFRVRNWATPYQSSDGWSARQINDAGFMSGYGASRVAEDFAEFVGWTYVKGAYPDFDFSGWSDIQDSACQEMSQHGEADLPARFSAVYTKLMFLQDLGLVAADDVDACKQSRIGLPDRSSGFHFWHAGNKLRTIGDNMTAGIGTTDSGNRIFTLEAEGEAIFDDTYPATLGLQLDLGGRGKPLHEISWPRGVYDLGLFGDNNLRLRLDGARAGNFDVKDGYVLVAEASNGRIAGSIVITVAFRIHAPLPVPQTWDPPLIIRFHIEN